MLDGEEKRAIGAGLEKERKTGRDRLEGKKDGRTEIGWNEREKKNAGEERKVTERLGGRKRKGQRVCMGELGRKECGRRQAGRTGRREGDGLERWRALL